MNQHPLQIMNLLLFLQYSLNIVVLHILLLKSQSHSFLPFHHYLVTFLRIQTLGKSSFANDCCYFNYHYYDHCYCYFRYHRYFRLLGCQKVHLTSSNRVNCHRERMGTCLLKKSPCCSIFLRRTRSVPCNSLWQKEILDFLRD